MRFPYFARALARYLQLKVAAAREPDFIVGADSPDGPYLRRWWLIPRNRVFNVYLHEFLRDDDDRAMHDHPWPWASFLLDGEYIEHSSGAGGITGRLIREAGSLKVSGPRRRHRIELFNHQDDPRQGKDACWTLFITGPVVREWGFWCPQRGWVHWKEFTAEGKPGEIGPGCDA